MKRRERTRHIAVVGGGYWGKNLIRNHHELGSLRTICDRDAETLARHGERYPGIELTDSYSRVLNDSDVAAVVLATPAPTHAKLAREALLAGKDVYVEKPLCLSERDGEELVEIADSRGRILMVGHLLWYHPAVLKLKELVDEGALGRIYSIYSNRLNLGKLRREENVLWSFAPHDISLMLGLLGELPESVQAQGGNFLHREIADTTVTLFRFASGVHAHIFVSWLHPFKEQKLVVVGDQRMAVFDDTAPSSSKLQLFPHSIEWKDRIPTASKAPVAMVDLPETEPLKAECEHFLECIETRATPRTDGREGLEVLRVLNACQEALKSRAAVPVAPAARPRSPAPSPYQIHETAVVDEGVEIGAGTKIWHFSHVLAGSKIGCRCIIGQNASIGPGVRIGDNCKIQNNVSVYRGVTLEEGVFCGPSMVFTNVMNPRAEIERKDEFRETLVRRGCSIGANATIICGHTLGEYSFIGAGAVVTRDVPPHALVVGNPARIAGWMCACGVRLEIAEKDASARCEACGSEYIWSDAGGLERATGAARRHELHRPQEIV